MTRSIFSYYGQNDALGKVSGAAYIYCVCCRCRGGSIALVLVVFLKTNVCGSVTSESILWPYRTFGNKMGS